MPGRRRPPAAAVLGVLGVAALVATIGLIHARREPPVQSAAAFPSWATLSCAVVRADRWSPLPGVEYTGRLELDLPAAPAASLVLIVSDPLRLDLDAQSVTGHPIAFQRERLQVGPGTAVPPDLWLESGNPLDLPREAIRATFEASPVGRRRVTLHMGRRAPRVLARLNGYPDSARASVCAARLGVVEAFESGDRFTIVPAMSELFGAGWGGAEATGGGDVRWMGAIGAILLPSARDGAVSVRLVAAPGLVRERDDPPILSMRVNDVFETAPVPMADGFSTYTWDVPDRAWLAHTNELLFTVSRTAWVAEGSHRPRALGLALRELELELVGERSGGVTGRR